MQSKSLYLILSAPRLHILEDIISNLRDAFNIVWEFAKKVWSDLNLDAPKESRIRKNLLNMKTVQLLYFLAYC